MDEEQGKDSATPTEAPTARTAAPTAAHGPPKPAAGVPDARSEEAIADAFARIENDVRDGRNDLGRLGFWRVLARIKPDRQLSEEWADAAGRIDRTVFERRVRLRVPIWVGNLALSAGIALGAAGVVVARRSGNDLFAGAGLIAAAGAWSVSVHDLAHWAVGGGVGIRFTTYFFRPGQFPPRPGIKTDYATYLRTDPAARASMHAAGAIATKLAPVVALAFAPTSRAPAWASWLVLALAIGQIGTDVAFSVKTGDWSKVFRERAIARERSARERSTVAR